jgi:hypothetical protein
LLNCVDNGFEKPILYHLYGKVYFQYHEYCKPIRIEYARTVTTGAKESVLYELTNAAPLRRKAK